MIDLIKLFDKNGKTAVYIGGNINGIYHYLEIFGDPTTLTTSDQSSTHFGPSYSISNETAYPQPVLADLCMRQKNICEFCGSIEHKAYA